MVTYMLVSGAVRPGGQMFYGTAPSFVGSVFATAISLIMLGFLVFVNQRVGKNAES